MAKCSSGHSLGGARGPRPLFTVLASGFALGLVGMSATARAADTDNYSKVTQVTVPFNAYTCTFTSGGVPFNTSSGFTFDISLVDQAMGKYLLADSSHGRPSTNTEGGVLANATSGDVLVIDTDNPGAGFTTLLPPLDDPFAGHRCDINADFGGVLSGPPGHQSDRNEISGPNGALLVNDTQIWVGDGPSYFNPGQTNSASDYKTDPCDSSVRVFSLITKKQIAHINTRGCFRTDEGDHDPVDQVALIANPSEKGSVAAIDPHSHPVDHAPFITLISTVPNFNGDEQDSDRGGDHDGDWGGDQDNWGGDQDQDGGVQFKILKQINFDGTNGTVDATGGIEQAAYSRQTGLFYIAVPANNVPGTVGTQSADGFVTVVDPRPGHLNVVANLALKSGSCPGGPTGAALGPNHQLLLGCGGASPAGGMVVVTISNTAPFASTASPTIIADGSQSCDEVSYDAGSGHYGGACMSSTTPPGQFALLVDDARTSPPQFDVQLGAASGAHSIAADSINEQFWMPKVGGDCGSATTACVAVYSGDDSDVMAGN